MRLTESLELKPMSFPISSYIDERNKIHNQRLLTEAHKQGHCYGMIQSENIKNLPLSFKTLWKDYNTSEVHAWFYTRDEAIRLLIAQDTLPGRVWKYGEFLTADGYPVIEEIVLEYHGNKNRKEN